jgi:hypothetical protein
MVNGDRPAATRIRARCSDGRYDSTSEVELIQLFKWSPQVFEPQPP